MIRRLVSAALCAVILALGAPLVSASPAQTAGTKSAISVVSKKRDSARLVRYLVSTPSLGMSTTKPLRIDVILPTGYAKHRGARYPVLYALPGTASTADQWLDQMDTMRMTKQLNLIVVAVDGGYDANGGSFWTNWFDQNTSLGVANWETFHNQELVPWIDAHFRTVSRRGGRAIVGISQGGFGSLSYAARHPKLFGATAAFSGAVDIYQGKVCRAGATTLISAIMTGQNGVQPFAPFGDPVTNADNWKAHDPGSNVDKLMNTKVDLYVSKGQPDQSELTDPVWPAGAGLEAVIYQSNLCFKGAADAAGLKFGWHAYAIGMHTQPYMNRDLADYLPRLMRFFTRHGALARAPGPR